MFFGGEDPFEHMRGHGGMGGGSGRSRGPVDNNKLYEVLGVAKDADESEIRKAYKKLALKNHPDKGGDVEKFKEISSAADILSDPEKRKMYDQYGMEGLEGQGGGGGQSAEDIFSMFFGGGGGGGSGRRGPRKGEDQGMAVHVTLEELYNGATKKLTVNRDKPCKECDGRGGKEGAEKTCKECKGHGVRLMIRQMGPMIQQCQVACSSCEGTGKLIDEKDKCGSCRGRKVYRDRKILEVHIEKGMAHGSKQVFSGEADEVPGTLPGDVVAVIQEDRHAVFKRSGSDLMMEMELTLNEALCGFVKTVKQLDGRILKVEVPPGKVTKHDSYKAIRGEGMPLRGNPFNKGALFVHFTIRFPSQLPKELVTKLNGILPKVEKPVLTGEEEDCEVSEDIDVDQFGRTTNPSRGGGFGGDEDDEDDEGHGSQRVQCGQN